VRETAPWECWRQQTPQRQARSAHFFAGSTLCWAVIDHGLDLILEKEK
jgi:hypothetical protein